MTLDRLWQLDATNPTSNSNYAGANIQENCAPSGINNALRALGQMVTRELAFQASAISASVSTNIVTSSTGLLVPIVGANAINSFGVVPGEQPSAAVLRFLQFSSSASLSHGGSIRLLGQASRKTQPGDIGGYIHVGSGDTWHEFLWSRAADADGNFASLSASVAAFTTLNAASASVSHVTATTISASVINVAGVQEFPRIVFRATKSGSQLSISSAVTVVFGSEDIDVGGFFASNAWTPPAGTYRITANITWTTTNAVDGERLTVAIQKDGVDNATTDMPRNGTAVACSQNLSAIVSANGSNVFTVAATKGGAGTGGMGSGSQNMFCGERI